MCTLVIVWVGAYWFYEPGEPPVTFDDREGGGGGPGEVAVRPDPLAALSPGSSLDQDAVRKASRAVSPTRKPQPDSLAKPPKTNRTDPATPATRVIPPKFHEYVVQPGDTLQLIAKKLLGDAKHWKAIASANSLTDPRKLIPGRTRLLIPDDPKNVEGLVVPAESPTNPDTRAPVRKPDNADKPESKPGTPEATPAPASQEFTEYVIQSQDTLSGIAKTIYGKASLWRLIYEANPETIPDPDHLKVGTTIKIPKNPN